MAVYPITLDIMADQVASNLEINRPNKRHREVDLLRYINYAMVEFARRTRAVHVVKFLHVSADISRYSLPPDALRGQVDEVLFLRDGALSGAQYPLKKTDRRGLNAVTAPALSGILSTIAYVRPGRGAPTHYLIEGNVIEFRPIPTSAQAGANRIAYKAPGIPDAILIPGNVPEIAVEHRNIVVGYATYLGQIKDKDVRSQSTLNQFLADCEQVNSDIKWSDQEEPPVMQPEDWYAPAEWSIK